MSKTKSRLLLISISLISSIFISFFTLLIVNKSGSINFIDFFKILAIVFITLYIIGVLYTRFFLYKKLKEITKDIFPKEDMRQTVNTNMEELVNEIKDYDSKRKLEYSEMKKQESFMCIIFINCFIWRFVDRSKTIKNEVLLHMV